MSTATHSVVLRLDPAVMQEPDLEVRWDIEKLLHAEHPDLSFFDDGYGFAKHSDAMLLSFATSDPDGMVAALADLLTNRTVSGNRLAPAAMVAVAPRIPVVAGEEFVHHRVVFPPDRAGSALPD